MDFIAWWGAGLSTLLALVKLWELWRDRFRVDVAYCFTGSSEVGSDIHIRNLTGRPLIVGHWELFYRPHLWPLRKDIPISSPDGDGGDLIVDAHSSKTIHFSRDEHFDWGAEVMKGYRILMRIYIAGRKPVLKKVYG